MNSLEVTLPRPEVYRFNDTTMSGEEILRGLLKEIAHEQDYKNEKIDVHAVSSVGANYSSALYKATISSPLKEDLKLFGKVANVDKALQETNDLFKNAYNLERFFYTELVVIFEKLYNKHGVPEEDRLQHPKYYGHKAVAMEDTLVLGDLSAIGFGDFDRFKTFDWDYASSAIKEITKFHALGLAFKKENPEELDKLQSTVLIDLYANEEMKDVFLKMAIKSGTQVINEEYRCRLKKYLDEKTLLDGCAKLWKPMKGGFLIHGDYRPSNLMHRKRNGRIEVVPLDYQTFHLGPLAADLMYFIWLGSDSNFRRNFYHQLLEHYYKELTIALKNLHLEINEVYPRDIFEQELEDTKPLVIFLGLGIMPVLTVDPEDAPKYNTFENFNIEPNQKAIDRMNGIVSDHIEWGII